MNKTCRYLPLVASLFISLTLNLVCPMVLRADEIASAIPEDNLLYPVIIGLDSSATGSGFYLNTPKCIYFVTAKHVLYKQEDKKWVLNGKKAVLQSSSKNLEGQKFEINLEELLKHKAIISHPTEDLVLVKMGELTGPGQIKISDGVSFVSHGDLGIVGMALEGLKKFDDVHVSNDVYIFGFPTSLQNPALGLDFSNPLLRKGIVAGKDIKSKKIILDVPVYFGNSGGLVIESGFNVANPMTREYRAIGIVLGMIPFINEFKNKQYGYSNFEVENSGYSFALPMDFLLDLIKSIEN